MIEINKIVKIKCEVIGTLKIFLMNFYLVLETSVDEHPYDIDD